MSWLARFYPSKEGSKAVHILCTVYIVFAIGIFLALACFVNQVLAGSSYRYNPPRPSSQNDPYERSEEAARKAFEQLERNRAGPAVKDSVKPVKSQVSPGERASGSQRGN